MSVELPNWTTELKVGIKHWLDSLMERGEPYGRYRLAKEGCLHVPYDIISVHFAADLYEKLGLVDTLTSKQKREWIDLSLSWSDPESGEVTDPSGLEKGVTDNNALAGSVSSLRRNFNRTCHGVFGSGKNKPVLQDEVKEFLDIEKMKKAFDAEAWKTNSWGAGAHCGHYINAMLEYKKAGFCEFEKPIEAAVNYLYDRQNPDNGVFCDDSHCASSKIGGALKIYVRLFGTMNLEIKYPERIIDTALSLLRSGEFVGVCEAHNALILLLMCGNFTDYRINEIKSEALLALERDVHPHLMDDGGFCSNPGIYEKYIWGVKMFETDGVEQGDIHGTMIMVQAVRVVAELLDLEDQLGFAPSGWKREI